MRRGLDRGLFKAVTNQPAARGVVARTRTQVDATLISSASPKRDDEARWAGHRWRKPVHGYKAHIATDQGAGLIHGVEVTTANVHDPAELETILPDAPGPTYCDSAYQGSRPERIIRARGGTRVSAASAPFFRVADWMGWFSFSRDAWSWLYG